MSSSYPIRRRRRVQPDGVIPFPSRWDRPADQLYPKLKNMNTHTVILVLLLGVVAIIGFLLLTDAVSVGQSQAQDPVDLIATAHIPFDFWVGSTRLPAGEYDLYRSLGLNSVVVLRSAKDDAQEEAFLLPLSGPVAIGHCKLIFINRKGKHYLHEVWNVHGRAILTSEFAMGVTPGDTRSEVPLRFARSAHSAALRPTDKTR